MQTSPEGLIECIGSALYSVQHNAYGKDPSGTALGFMKIVTVVDKINASKAVKAKGSGRY